MKKIIFINLIDSSFIRMDEEILKKKYRVATFKFKYRKGLKVLIDIFHQFFFMLVHIWSSDLIYIWFADFHAVIPTLFGKIFNKRVIVVIGGYDAVFDKELHYGAKTRKIGYLSVKMVTSMADYLLPVSNFTLNELLKNYSPELSNKSTVIYNGFNSMFQCKENIKKENSVATVCLTSTKSTLFVKGVDFYIQLAEKIPDTTFYIVGVSGGAKEYLNSVISENVVLTEKIPPVEVRDILCKTKVICQFSRYEAFGVALLEGIACGNYPVGYNHAGTKEILINNCGILIEELDINEGVLALKKALNKNVNDIQEIKISINERFSKNARAEKLISFLMNTFRN